MALKGERRVRRARPEKDAERLASAFEQRKLDLADRGEELLAAESAAEHEKAAANLARGLDEITEAEHAERIATAESRVAEATSARDSARDVLAEVARAAADAAAAVERAKVEAATADVERTAHAREEAEAMLVQLAADEALAEERLAIVGRWAKDARAPFDADAAAEADHRAKADGAMVVWYAGEGYRADDPRIEEPWLRGDVAAEIARRASENADYQRRLKERPDRVDAHGDPHTIAQGEAFPVTKPVG